MNHLLFLLLFATASPAQIAPKPLHADPNYHGSCDPEVVRNDSTGEVFVFYTARRATREKASYVGTPIGAISSTDLVRWKFRGYLTMDGNPGAMDMPVTYWAPGIVRHGGRWHMFVTYKDNARPPWGGKGSIRHYSAPMDDPIASWKLEGIPDFPQPDPIDASLIVAGSSIRAYYRVGNNGGIHWSESSNLLTWKHHGRCGGDVNKPGVGYQEAPYVFRFKGAYWMLTDPHSGLNVYRSGDGQSWEAKGKILADGGDSESDRTHGRHASVLVRDDRAFLFYHVEPWRPYPSPPPEQRTVRQKMSFLQMVELQTLEDRLVCDRDQPVQP